MDKNKKANRRQFLASSALAIGAAVIGTGASSVSAQENEYIFEPPATTSMRVINSSARFPVRRIFCLGYNYRAHAIESGDDPDANPPFYFVKPRDAVVDSRDGHPYPPMTSKLRHEVEMVVAIKSGGSNISEEDALSHIYAYGVGLDMTRDDLQEVAVELSRPWAISKAFDHSAPTGPLYPVDTYGHAVTGRIWLSVNDEMRQDSDLSYQRWSVPEAIAHISQHIELKTGDLIMTGTPEGIGLVDKGDVIKCGIEGLGEIEVLIT